MSIEPISRSGPLTRWLRAGPWEIPFSEEIQMMGLRPPGFALFVSLSGLEEWSWYDPMVDARDAYLVCASIRDDLWVEPNDHAERDVRKRILDFFNRYGPLLYGPQLFRGEMGPLEKGPEGDPVSNIAVPLWEVIKHATLLAVALRCYQALEVNWDKYHAGFEAAMDRTEVQDLHLTPNPSRLWGAPPLDGVITLTRALRRVAVTEIFKLTSSSGVNATTAVQLGRSKPASIRTVGLRASAHIPGTVMR